MSHTTLQFRHAVAALAVLACTTVPAAAAQAQPPRDPGQRTTSASTEVPCFMGRHNWNSDLAGPPPMCTVVLAGRR